MSMHFLATALGGLLERLYPTAVPPYDYDTALADVETECEDTPPYCHACQAHHYPDFAGAAASLTDDSGSSDNPVGSSASKQQSATSVDPHSLSPTYTSGDSSSHSPREDHPAGASDAPPVVEAPAGLPSIDWLSIGVQEILSCHMLYHNREGARWVCSEAGRPCGEFDSQYDWREHVAPLIAEHILNCIKAFRTK